MFIVKNMNILPGYNFLDNSLLYKLSKREREMIMEMIIMQIIVNIHTIFSEQGYFVC